jgi:hypothetical protein
VKDNLNAARRSVLLEPNDRVDGAGEALPEASDRDTGTLT